MAEPYKSANVSLIFDGGLAAGGELHFYEYSRCVYAYSRLLQTIEYYRRQGIVAERIAGSANTDIIIRAPQQGSFIIDATVRAAEKVLPYLKATPFEALLSLVIDNIKDTPADKGVSGTIAKIAARTNIGPQAPLLDAARSRAISQGDAPSTREMLELAQWAKSSSDPSIARAGISDSDLREIALRAEADLRRQKQIRPYSDDLTNIPVADLTRLTSRVRPMISDIGLPLRKSADKLSFASGKRRQAIARLDIADIRSIDSREIDSDTVCVDASIKSYGKETGHGRLRQIDDNKVISFSIPSNLRPSLNRRVTTGMNRESVVFVAFPVRDLSGTVTSYIVSNLE